MIHVLSLIDSGILGGPGKGLLQLVKHSNPEELKFSIVNFEYLNPKSTEFFEVYEENKVPVHKVFSRAFGLNCIFALANLIKSVKPDILQSHGYKAHLYCLMLSKLFGIPWVAVNHGFTTENLKTRLYHRLDRITVPFSDLAVCVSEDLYNYFHKIRKGKPTVLINNAVDKNELSSKLSAEEIRAACNASSEQILLGAFGRLSLEKGQLVLLKAFHKLLDERQDLRLVLLGEGPAERDLKSFTEKHQLDSYLSFHGHQRNMADYYKAIDFLVLPSLSEGMPNVVLEALVSGVPVIATKVGAVSKVVQGGFNGVLVEPGSEKNLREGLLKALSKQASLQAGAAQGLEESFTPRYRVERFYDEYRKLIEYEH